ncbi:hypothetical protein [Euzebyella saccharophila]|uniref:DUF4292 domain-containing protein n=1 Tax=Euzebyella saccharophila TaxID=679664 RepID=A0ABV8JP10_9FLAO|nr:hypothetical protein [Euzebyella saccharophila]
MRILASSILFILFTACASYPKKQQFTQVTASTQNIINPYFSDTSKDYVYKANIDAFGNSFGGLFIVKKIGEKSHRMVFTTEMGTTIFDFSIKDQRFTVHKILKDMDRKILLNILQQDLTALVTEKLETSQRYQKGHQTLYESQLLNKKHYFYFRQNQLKSISRTKNGKEKVAHIFSDVEGNLAKSIRITHNNLPLQLTFKAL